MVVAAHTSMEYSGASTHSVRSLVSGSDAMHAERPCGSGAHHNVVKSNSRSREKNESSSGYEP